MAYNVQGITKVKELALFEIRIEINGLNISGYGLSTSFTINWSKNNIPLKYENFLHILAFME